MPEPSSERSDPDEEANRQIIARRWWLGTELTILMMLAYFGFVVLVALDKDTAGILIGDVVSVGILLGAGVIVLAPVLTAIYVRWANRYYDPAVKKLRAKGPS